MTYSREDNLRIRLQGLAGRFTRTLKKRVKTVSLSLPFGTVEVDLTDKEQTAAREVLIRLADHRVLTAVECCDDCIDRAMSSLRDVRSILTDEMVKLSDIADGPLYGILDMMRDGIKQFMTYSERLDHLRDKSLEFECRQEYFAALRGLRQYIGACITEVGKVGGTTPEAICGYEPGKQWQGVDVVVLPGTPQAP